jgi:hypothetical protein
VKAKPASVIGLDLSLRGTAAVCLHALWRPGDWPADDLTMRLGYNAPPGGDPERAAARLHDIAHAVQRFHARCAGRFGEVAVYVEDYAFGSTHRGMALGELGGAVKASMYRAGVVVVPLSQSTARRFFLNGQKVPRGKGGMATALAGAFAALPSSPPWEDSDRRDAFLVANLARTELGMAGLLARG